MGGRSQRGERKDSCCVTYGCNIDLNTGVHYRYDRLEQGPSLFGNLCPSTAFQSLAITTTGIIPTLLSFLFSLALNAPGAGLLGSCRPE